MDRARSDGVHPRAHLVEAKTDYYVEAREEKESMHPHYGGRSSSKHDERGKRRRGDVPQAERNSTAHSRGDEILICSFAPSWSHWVSSPVCTAAQDSGKAAEQTAA